MNKAGHVHDWRMVMREESWQSGSHLDHTYEMCGCGVTRNVWRRDDETLLETVLDPVVNNLTSREHIEFPPTVILSRRSDDWRQLRKSLGFEDDE